MPHPALRDWRAPEESTPSERDVDCCEPRAQLLWSIVGKATSTDWDSVSRGHPSPHSHAAISDQGSLKVRADSVVSTPGQSIRRSSTAEPQHATERTAGPVPAAIEESSTQSAQAAPDPCLQHGSATARLQDACSLRQQHLPLQRQAAKTCADVSVCWRELPSELVPLFARASASPATAQALSGVCRSWREAILDDSAMLKSLPMQCMWLRDIVSVPKQRILPLPQLIHKASVVGNANASVAAARALEHHLLHAEAFKFWGRAARAGDAASQVQLGKAYYLGQHGVGEDCEEALRWLSRGVKQMLACNTCTGPWQNDQGCKPRFKEVFRDGAFVLGLLHLDGVVGPVSAGEAVRWLRAAAKHGSREAPAVLGTLFNTGQYG